jgi:hypothetical protein
VPTIKPEHRLPFTGLRLFKRFPVSALCEP